MKYFSYIATIFSLLSLSLSSVHANEMIGMYSYMADVGLFLECGQNKKHLPVAMEGDNIALQRAYLKNRYMSGKSLLVNVKGHSAMRPKMEGDGKEDVIVVDQFLSIAQQESCTGIVPPSPLENTYWQLVELDGQRLKENKTSIKMRQKKISAMRDIYFIIKKDNKITGFSGCNRFSGNLTFTEKSIKIGSLMSTQMACPAMAIERQFNNRLSQADNYKIKGESLELFHHEKSTAKFIAIYF